MIEPVAARQQRAFSFEARADIDGAVEGYGSVFGVQDSYDDVVMPGAFAASIAAHRAAGTMPAMLWQHDANEPIGVWSEIREDDNGLYMKGRLALATGGGSKAYELLKMGAINGLSIGFMTKSAEWNTETGVREVREIELWEVSLVTFPANTAARVTAVRAADIGKITTIRQAEAVLRDAAGFSRDAARAFVAQVKRIESDERDAREVERVGAAALGLLTTLNFRR